MTTNTVTTNTVTTNTVTTTTETPRTAARDAATADRVTISGGVPVRGRVDVSGFKHVLVLAVAHLVGSGGAATLRNTPRLLETEAYTGLLPQIGVAAEYAGGSLDVDASGDVADTLPGCADAIHGSLYLLPALLARTGRVRFAPRFGGCRIGAAAAGERPWRHVVGVLEAFGARVDSAGEQVTLTAPALRPARIDLRDFTTDRGTLAGPEYSGATKAAVLAAALAHGTSVLRFPYQKAEITALVELLSTDGLAVERTGDDLAITGAAAGSGTRPGRMREFSLPPDFIEVVTWVTIAAVTGGSLELAGVTRRQIDGALAAEARLWESVGVELAERPRGVLASGPRLADFGALPWIETVPASIYSDSQPLFAVLASRCPGPTRIVDAVWSGRYAYLDGLARLGAVVARERDAVVVGQSVLAAPPGGVDVEATDLRCAAALVTAALAARGGPVTVHGIHHLNRGYERLLEKLGGCGPS